MSRLNPNDLAGITEHQRELDARRRTTGDHAMIFTDTLIVEMPKVGPPITVAEVKLRLHTLIAKLEMDGEYSRQITAVLALEAIEKLQQL